MELGDIKARTRAVALGSRWRGLTALALAFTLGCERPATEVVVRVDSEIAWGLGQRVQSVVLEVRRAGPDGPLRSRQVTPVGTGAGRRPLPLFVGVSESVGDPTTPLWIEALGCAQSAGCARDGAVSAQRALVRFVPEQTVELTLLLSPACGAARCSLDQSCTPSGSCLPASTAQSTLRPIAGVPTDAASAAATSDATAVDAAMDAPAPPDSPLPPDGAPMGDAEPFDRPDAAPTDRPDAEPTDRPTSDDVPADSAPSDLPGDVRPADGGSMDAGLTDLGADASPDVAPTDAGPRDSAPDASPADAMDASPADASPTDATDASLADALDASPADVGPALRCPAGMVLAPAGEFLMGSNANMFERPIHRVRLSAFCIDVTEVTVAAFRACPLVNCGQPAANPMCNHRGLTGRDSHPVNCVDWSQAAGYCSWSGGGRLPSEAQWEYAARGTDGRVYPWGDTFEVDRLCMNPLAPLTSTCPVNSYPRGNSLIGVADMGGNVSEWVLDTYAGYMGNMDVAVMDPVITGTGTSRVIRGSAFNADNTSPLNLGRASLRSAASETAGIFQIGFRCVRTPLSP